MGLHCTKKNQEINAKLLAWKKEVILFRNDNFDINYACSVWTPDTIMLIGLKVLQSKLMLNYMEVLEQNSRI